MFIVLCTRMSISMCATNQRWLHSSCFQCTTTQKRRENPERGACEIVDFARTRWIPEPEGVVAFKQSTDKVLFVDYSYMCALVLVHLLASVLCLIRKNDTIVRTVLVFIVLPVLSNNQSTKCARSNPILIYALIVLYYWDNCVLNPTLNNNYVPMLLTHSSFWKQS